MSGATGGGRAVDGLLVGLAVAVLAAFWWWGSERERPLDRSAVGFDGLAVWLRAEGHAARSFVGWSPVDPAEVGLRVLPLYDVDVYHDREEPESEEELLYQQTEVDIRGGVIGRKIASLPTLVVLPKWRTGMRLTGKAHPVLLADIGAILGLVGVTLDLKRRRADHGSFDPLRYQARDGRLLEAQLYLPQLLKLPECEPVIGNGEAMLLGRCSRRESDFWLLTDPDLLNGHGLRLGDNAAIAATLLPELAASGQILVDYTTWVWAEGLERPERQWSDLLRFFGPPFTALWLGLGLLLALLIWRASVRYGAPLRRGDEGIDAAKAASVEAKARLLRLAGHDDELLALHVSQRLQLAAATLLGPHRSAGADPLDQVAAWAARRDGALADQLRQAAGRARGGSGPSGDALALLHDFENALERVLHEPGRSARHS